MMGREGWQAGPVREWDQQCSRGPPSSPSAGKAFGMTRSGLSACLFRGTG